VLVNRLNAIRSAIGRGLFQAITSSAAKELFATLVSPSTHRKT
jgi:hypothetical protein